MALTITQRPTSPNAAYTRLLYAISGSIATGQPLHQYFMDVYVSGSATKLKRVFQTINPAGSAIFDPSRIIQGDLQEDQSWKISSLTPFNSSSKTYRLEFGESFASSISSSVLIFPNEENDDIEIFRGVVEPNDGYYNWPSSSKAVLSNMPATMSMQPDDYGTIGVYNNSVQYISQSFYSANNNLLGKVNYSVTDNFSSIPISSSFNWNYLNLEVSSSIGKQNYRYEVSNKIHNEKVRFAFINKQGTWDYYNNFNPVRQGMDVTRQQYTAPRVDYSSITSTYDITRRGRTVNNSVTDDSFTVDTDWLTKTHANWLEELIESPSVYIQRNGEFIPIIINNSNYTSKTSAGRQKLFKYTLNFTPSNQPFGTWIPEYVECPTQIDTVNPILTTLSPTGVTGYSMTFQGSIDSTGEPNTIVERGFVYSTSSAVPTISDNKTFTGSPPFTTGSYSINSGAEFLPDSTVYYRAYASSSNGAFYGNVVTTQTLSAFDPTLSSTLNLNYWFDFTDSTTMTFSGSNYITEIQSKGNYNTTLTTGSGTKYTSYWEAPTWIGEYTQFNGVPGVSHSTLASIYGNTGSALDMNPGEHNFTTIFFAEPNFNGVSTNIELIQNQAGNATVQYYNLINEFPDTSPNTQTTYLSNSTSSISASWVGYVSASLSPVRTAKASYSYNNTQGSWESRFNIIKNTSPIVNRLYYVTSSRQPSENKFELLLKGSGQGSDYENLTIGGDSSTTGGNANQSAKFKLAHFLVYSGSLTYNEIDDVINSFTGSVSYGSQVNSITN